MIDFFNNVGYKLLNKVLGTTDSRVARKDIFVELGMEIHSSEYGLDSNKEINKDTIKQFREADSVNFTLTNNNKKTEVTLDKENLHINGDLENATTLTVSEIKVQRYDKVNKKLNGKIECK